MSELKKSELYFLFTSFYFYFPFYLFSYFELRIRIISFLFDLSIQPNSQEPLKNTTIDMKVNTLRGQSTSSSTYSFRVILVYSDIFSTIYAEHIQALTNNPTWANQVEISESEKPTLSYVIPKIGETNNTNKTTVIETISKPHSMNNSNTYSPKGLEPFTILYSINQPTDLQL